MLKPFHRSTSHVRARARIACTAGLALVIVTSSALTAPTAAFAASAETRSELAHLQEKVCDAATTYAAASSRADELNAQASSIADEILSIEQDQMPVQQQRAAQAARKLYKSQESAANTVTMLLSAGSLSEFFAMNKYLTTIQDDHVDALEELNRLRDELDAKLGDMSKAKDDAETARQQASDALAQAKTAAVEIQQKANAEDAAEAEVARQATAQAAALAAQEAAKQQGSGESANSSQNTGNGSLQPSAPSTDQGKPTQPEQQPSQPQQPQQPSDGNQSNNQTQTPNQGGWKSGKASHYGTGDGFLGKPTASGALVTETSMGVAMLNVPLGTKVEIRYRGRSVVAVVNDRGPYAHDRVIDMQPAVARALDFLSVGVDTVEYRFL